jgi:hypothetical protein
MLYDEYARGYQAGFLDALNMRDNFKISIFGMDAVEVLRILNEHYLKKQQSEVPNIPIGFTFNWNDREKINGWFGQLSKQGFEVKKKENRHSSLYSGD